MCNNKPDLFAICESNLHGGFLDTDFLVPGYLPMHCNDSTHMHGLGSMFEIAFLSEDINEPFMCFRLALLHSTAYILPSPFTIFILRCGGRCVQKYRL